MDSFYLDANKFDDMKNTLESVINKTGGFKFSHQQKIQIDSFMAKLDNQAEQVAESFNKGTIIQHEDFFEADFLSETVQALNEVMIKSAYQHTDKKALNSELDALCKMMPKNLTVGKIIKETKSTSTKGDWLILDRLKDTNTAVHDQMKSFYNKDSVYPGKNDSFGDFIIKLQTQLNGQEGFNTTIQDQMKSLNANVEYLLHNLVTLDTANSKHWQEAIDKIHLASDIYTKMQYTVKDDAKSDVHKLMPDFEGHTQPLVVESHKDGSDGSHQ